MLQKRESLIIKKLRDLTDNPPENFSIARVQAKSVVEAYPENDRPRGTADIKSVNYHMKSGSVPPAFMIEWNTKTGTRSIFLDGMHRIVAASLSKKRKISIFLITIKTGRSPKGLTVPR
jgi:hypothetical protein